MRAVPFRIAFVAGLDEGGRSGFASRDRTSPLDLRREARAGDVSPRDRDRAAFLDVLLCTRDAFYLSYVAVEPNSGQALGPSSIVLELADALAPYLGAASSRDALLSITRRFPLHRFGSSPGATSPGATSMIDSPGVHRERWACRVRDELRAHLRATGHPIPDEDGQLALLGHASQHTLREELAVGGGSGGKDVVATRTSRSLSIANLRGFLEYPIQAWAQAALGLDELPDDDPAEQSDEPFHLAKKDRAGILREAFATHLRDSERPLEHCYDDTVADLQLRGQFPVGVFADAARALDLGVLQRWREGLGQISLAHVARFGFGRAWSPGAELRPALAIDLPGGRSVRLVGQTELLIAGPDRFLSVVPMLRELERRTAYHLRGAFDHVVLAAAGIANGGHAHQLIDPEGRCSRIQHAAWSERDARTYLAGLATELLDHSHGYLLPFETLAKALGGKPNTRTYGDPTHGLGYGPVERRDGLAMPVDVMAIAQRRLRPLVERMFGDHSFEISRSSPPTTRPPPPPPPFSTGAPTVPPSPGARPMLTVIKGGRP
jgi:hypothetical protein